MSWFRRTPKHQPASMTPHEAMIASVWGHTEHTWNALNAQQRANLRTLYMAGGDGDVLSDIEQRLNSDRDDFGGGWNDHTIQDRRTLLTMVREQRAVIERVEELAEEWARELENPEHLIYLEDALVAIRAALTATEPTK